MAGSKSKKEIFGKDPRKTGKTEVRGKLFEESEKPKGRKKPDYLSNSGDCSWGDDIFYDGPLSENQGDNW